MALASTSDESTHASDAVARLFAATDFDAAAYLNSHVPSLAVPSPSPQSRSANVSLAETSTAAQDLVSQLDAQIVRLSNTLNQLTEDILRSGGRIAYEVDVLKGDADGLTEALRETLKDDIARLTSESRSQPDGDSREVLAPRGVIDPRSNVGDPPYVAQLRTLLLVRARLESVIQVFGQAMEWLLPPSALNAASSSFISISSPEDSSESQSREVRGQEYQRKLKSEIESLVRDGQQGLVEAEKKIGNLRELTAVWKGTAEEKGRDRLVEALSQILDAARAKRKVSTDPSRQSMEAHEGASLLPPRPDVVRRQVSDGGPSQSRLGFIEGLKGLRDNLYLE